MPLLNYTTTIAVQKTIGEIHVILANHGAKMITTDYDENRQPCGIMFLIPTPWGDRSFRLPANIEGIRRTLERQWSEGRIEPRFTKPEHAARVGWRIVKDWIEAQTAIIEAGMVTFDQVMLPYLEDVPGGPLLYESMVKFKLKLLPEKSTG